MDFWHANGFEISEGDDYGGMEIMPDGSLEINVCAGITRGYHEDEIPNCVTLVIPAERAPEVLVGIQAWIEQLTASTLDPTGVRLKGSSP